ncbi:sulfatase-like hydrolase/transferase [Verrucomicrobiales bacterium]|jgi:arylsulfatase A-like enzyme|nr:sulfatase-like hydrolase/transferase [Verrucomicrobiales bacterium]
MLRFLCLFLFVFLPASFTLGKDAPNILFIYTDDHSYRAVSCYEDSYDWIKTPNMDALADSGVRFAHATVGTWCMPSRAMLLTGHHSFGVESMRMEGDYPGSAYDPEQCRFWPSVFREQGYQTAQIGKWHTGIDTGFGRDWDYQIVWNRPRYPENSKAYYYDQLIEKNGGDAVMTKGYSTDNYTQWAVDYINGEEGREEGKPWYLWLCYGGVHGPFTPADRHLNDYKEVSVEDPADIYPPRAGKPTYSRNVEQWVKGPDGEPVLARGKSKGGIKTDGKKTLTEWVRQVNQAVSSLDEGIGRVMESLKESGQLDNTLVVFTSDQGFAWGQHGFQVKQAPYDANIRSPMIVSFPERFSKRSVCKHPIGGVDIVPTIFEVAGLELPWEMHGDSLVPLLKDPTQKEWNNPVLTVHTGDSYGSASNVVPVGDDEASRSKLYMSGDVPWWVSLVEADLKYIRTLVPGEPEELYDLTDDPAELVNLALDAKHSETVVRLRNATIAELKRNGAKLVETMPAVAELP